jgi:hypothetical protein
MLKQSRGITNPYMATTDFFRARKHKSSRVGGFGVSPAIRRIANSYGFVMRRCIISRRSVAIGGLTFMRTLFDDASRSAGDALAAFGMNVG